MRLTLAKIGWMLCVPAVAVISVSAINSKKTAVVSELMVEIEDFDQGAYFLTEDDLRKELEAILGENERHINDLHSDEIESALEANPFISKADVYVSSDGELSLKVVQKEPMARVFSAQGKSFYIGAEGDVIPLSPYFSAHVPVITGHVNPVIDVEQKGYGQWIALQDFIRVMSDDAFMHALVEQIDVNRNQEFTLIPKIGNTEIYFGSLENTEAKIENLKAFYKRVMVADGWDLYKRIDLSYDRQIVCKKSKTDS